MRYSVLLLAAAVLQAGTVTETFTFNAGDLRLVDRDGVTLVTGAGMDVTDQPGAPQLPVRPLSVALPGRARVTAVRFEPQGWTELAAGITPFPAPRQVILSLADNAVSATAPDPGFYQAGRPWPEQPAVWTGTSTRDGRTCVDLLIYPVRYLGAGRRIEACRRLAVTVDYELLPPAPALDLDVFDYVIVTSTSLDTVFRRLADWKTQKGVRAVVRHISWVTGAFPGRDNAEKLRNYIKALPDSGVEYVLLGGDVNVIPFRKAFAMVSEGNIHQREDSLPCDLYFGDLDGTWDANGNNVFGEVDDSVDLYADLHVGRAPAENTADARAFVDKLLRYERGPSPGYLDNVLFFAEIMWSDPYTDGGVHKDRLERACFPAGYEVTKRYERLGNESRTSVMAAMRLGQNFMNHDGHGWIDIMSCGSSYMRTRDCDTITNTDHGILYSIGCWTTAYDENSIGEAWVNNPSGGGVAMIGNSSYGWGSPGNSGFGYSDKFDDRFWWAIQREDILNLGRALDWSKAWYAPFSHGRNVYRWHQYQVNLMGCPEMPVRTAFPCSLNVVAPADIPIGSTGILVTVASNGAPVPGALVCLMKDTESYSRALTNSAGAAWLATTPRTAGDFTLTVTARDCYPQVSTIPCVGGAYVNFAGWEVDDALGNGDGVVNPGEVVMLPTWVHNAGNAVSEPRQLVLRVAEPCISVEDSTADVCPLNVNESLRIADAFRVSVGPSPEDGRVVRFELVARDPASGDPRYFHPVFQVGRPGLEFERYYYSCPPALPGETKAVRLCVRNRGHGWGHDAWARLTSLDPNVTILAPESIPLGELAPGSSVTPADSFRVAIENSCPGSWLAAMQLSLRSEACAVTDTFSLLVGAFGFADDMESGGTRWTHGGTGDRWNLSTYRQHSGTHAWYCGDNASHRYSSNMNAWLQTVPFMVAEHCSLRFWRWFSVPNYGVDGIYVVVLWGGVAETLDFMGTGGALGDPRFGIESDWYEEKYDLGWIPVGETIQVKVSFKSDNDGEVGEGFYIDDFRVTGGQPPLTFIAERPRTSGVDLRLSALPSPFSRNVRLRLSGLPGQTALIRVYDAGGRIVNSFAPAGRHGSAELVWHGSDAGGRRLPAGAYFIEARAGDQRRTAKVLMTD